MSINLGTIWVCQCCMLSHANGECCAEPTHGGDSREPWALLTDSRFDVTMGIMAEEHEYYCEYGINGECDCDRDTFSTGQCEGCGSYLHGERFAFTLWRTRQRFTRPKLPA
jgi:hypothetical protein